MKEHYNMNNLVLALSLFISGCNIAQAKPTIHEQLIDSDCYIRLEGQVVISPTDVCMMIAYPKKEGF